MVGSTGAEGVVCTSAQQDTLPSSTCHWGSGVVMLEMTPNVKNVPNAVLYHHDVFYYIDNALPQFQTSREEKKAQPM